MGYKDVFIPSGKDPKKYTTHERRAAIFRLILRAGHPRAVPQTPLAEQFGVSKMTISRDFSRIASEIKADLGSDADLVSNVVYEKALRTLAGREDTQSQLAAVKVLESWNGYLADEGIRKVRPKEINVSGSLSASDLLLDAAEIAQRQNKSGE